MIPKEHISAGTEWELINWLIHYILSNKMDELEFLENDDNYLIEKLTDELHAKYRKNRLENE